MKNILTFLFGIFLCTSVSADPIRYENAPLSITDGSITTYPYQLIVGSGGITDNGNGTVTMNFITTGGGDSRYLRKDISDNNGTNTLTVGSLQAEQTFYTDYTIPSASFGQNLPNEANTTIFDAGPNGSNNASWALDFRSTDAANSYHSFNIYNQSVANNEYGLIFGNQFPAQTVSIGELSMGSGYTGGGTNFTGTSKGTYIAINGNTSNGTNFVDFQAKGASQFKVDDSGNVTSVATLQGLHAYSTGASYFGTGAEVTFDGSKCQLSSINNINQVDAFVSIQVGSSTAGATSFHGSDITGALNSGYRLGGVNFGGSFDTSHSLKSASSIAGFATESWSGSANGSEMRFYTTKNGGTALQQQMVIDSNGKVGINSTSPSAVLDVGGTTNLGGTLTIPYQTLIQAKNSVGNLAQLAKIDTGTVGVVNGSANVLWFAPSGNNSNGFQFGTVNSGVGGGSNALSLETNSVERIRIDSTGQVGIGTTIPAYPLDVIGNVRVGNSGSATGILNIIGGGGNSESKLQFGYGATPTLTANIDTSTVDMAFTSASGSPIRFLPGGSEKMRVMQTSGFVGINSTAPRGTLEVDGTTYLMGNVGINSVVPGDNLVISPSAVLNGITIQSGSYSNIGIKINNTVAGGKNYAMYVSGTGGGQGAGAFGIYDGTAYRIVISSTGNVGIGSVTPAAVLDVTGSIRSSVGATDGSVVCWKSDKTLGTCATLVGVLCTSCN